MLLTNYLQTNTVLLCYIVALDGAGRHSKYTDQMCNALLAYGR